MKGCRKSADDRASGCVGAVAVGPAGPPRVPVVSRRDDAKGPSNSAVDTPPPPAGGDMGADGGGLAAGGGLYGFLKSAVGTEPGRAAYTGLPAAWKAASYSAFSLGVAFSSNQLRARSAAAAAASAPVGA